MFLFTMPLGWGMILYSKAVLFHKLQKWDDVKQTNLLFQDGNKMIGGIIEGGSMTKLMKRESYKVLVPEKILKITKSGDPVHSDTMVGSLVWLG